MGLSRTEKNKKNRKKIETKEKREKRKTFILGFLKVFLAILLIVLCISSYVFYISTDTLNVKEYSNTYTNLPNEFHGFKIIQFGDLYYNKYYKSLFNKTIQRINELKPDLVIFTGGLIHHKYSLNESEKEYIITNLKKINATTGKYYVLSSSDNEDTISILNEASFKFLDDSTEEIYFNSTTPIVLHGTMKNYKENQNSDKVFQINIVNNPNDIDNILNNNSPNIIMSGKALNGQFRIPYYGGIIKKYKYVEPYYKIDKTDVYITSGLGTNNLPVRLFNHPSINFYRLKTK